MVYFHTQRAERERTRYICLENMTSIIPVNRKYTTVNVLWHVLYVSVIFHCNQQHWTTQLLQGFAAHFSIFFFIWILKLKVVCIVECKKRKSIFNVLLSKPEALTMSYQVVHLGKKKKVFKNCASLFLYSNKLKLNTI